MKFTYISLCVSLSLLVNNAVVFSQTQMTLKGFMDVTTAYNADDDHLFFALGEQDLFFTADLNKNVSFLGESVFKYDALSSTKFAVGLERAIIKYNYFGNHSILFGKFHTPINYWNDAYHHGRVFYPTTGRPEVFNSTIIPIHGTGVRVAGENLTSVKLGYDVLVSNGIGADDVNDNNNMKAITAAVHIKPIEGGRIGASFYDDYITAGAKRPGGGVTARNIKQNIVTGSVAYFKGKFELLSEYSTVMNNADINNNDSIYGTTTTHSYYGYAGFKIKDKYVPYFRFDYLETDAKETFFAPQNADIYTIGFRYEISYLSMVKAEYQYKVASGGVETNMVFLQFAVGF